MPAKKLSGLRTLPEQDAVGQQDLAVQGGKLFWRVCVMVRDEDLYSDAIVHEAISFHRRRWLN